MTENARLFEALQLYLDRQSRNSHPDGTFDRAHRWYPSESEQRPCCNHIRLPSRAWPHSLLTHCRSSRHIAQLMDVDLKELNRLIRAEKEQIRAERYVELAQRDRWIVGLETEPEE